MPRDLTDLEARLKPEVEPWRGKLMAAAEEVRKGWVQNRCGLPLHQNGPVCAGGAVMRVRGLTNFPNFADPVPEEYAQLSAYLKTIGYDCVARWNDEPGQTAESVASTMERVAGIGAMLGGR